MDVASLPPSDGCSMPFAVGRGQSFPGRASASIPKRLAAVPALRHPDSGCGEIHRPPITPSVGVAEPCFRLLLNGTISWPTSRAQWPGCYPCAYFTPHHNHRGTRSRNRPGQSVVPALRQQVRLFLSLHRGPHGSTKTLLNTHTCRCRVRRKREPLPSNGSIESDAAVQPSLTLQLYLAGPLPIEC